MSDISCQKHQCHPSGHRGLSSPRNSVCSSSAKETTNKTQCWLTRSHLSRSVSYFATPVQSQQHLELSINAQTWWQTDSQRCFYSGRIYYLTRLSWSNMSTWKSLSCRGFFWLILGRSSLSRRLVLQRQDRGEWDLRCDLVSLLFHQKRCRGWGRWMLLRGEAW